MNLITVWLEPRREKFSVSILPEAALKFHQNDELKARRNTQDGSLALR